MTEITALIQSEPVWAILIAIYLVAALGTFIPVIQAYRVPITPHPEKKNAKPVEVVPSNTEKQIDESPDFDPDTKLRLKQHYKRIEGALKVWKKMADQNKRVHQYSMFWLTLSAPLVPIMTQAIDGPVSKLFLTLVSLHAAVLLSFQRVLKPDQAYQAYRQSESDFYDLYRRMLDNPSAFGPDRKTQLQRYYMEVETVRKAARRREIQEYFPTFDADQMYNQLTNQMNIKPINAPTIINVPGAVPTVSTPTFDPMTGVVLPPGNVTAAASPQPEAGGTPSTTSVNVTTTIQDNSTSPTERGATEGSGTAPQP